MDSYHPSRDSSRGSRSSRDAQPMYYLDEMPMGYFAAPLPMLPPDRICSKFKTEMCRYFVIGQTCTHYETCTFSHGEKERRRNPLSPWSIDYKPVLCPEGATDPNEFCLNPNEYHYHPEIYKTKYCKAGGHGSPCTRSFCARAHFPQELRPFVKRDTPVFYCRYREWRLALDELRHDPRSIAYTYDLSEETPLHYAAKYANVEVIDKLLDLRANPNATDFIAQTPLHKLAAYNAPDALKAAKMLVKAGAKPDMKDCNDYTAGAFALKNKNYELLKLLEPALLPDDWRSHSSSSSSRSHKRSANGEEDERPTKRTKTEKPSTIVKCKFGSVIKMIKVLNGATAADLINQVSTKYDKEGLMGFLLKYVDEEGEQIDIGDEEDVKIFLESPKIKKILVIHEI